LPGDVLIKQNDIGDKFYIIIEGLADVVRENAEMEISDF